MTYRGYAQLYRGITGALPMHMNNARNAKEIATVYAHVQGRGWFKATMLDRWVPSYVGATRLTRYYERQGREYVEISYQDVPRSAYERLRRQLRTV